ncbi:LysM peptidoglycan-binding domain-containing protein [Sanguibacter suaedae]|uniref:LysM peptidoglycan-binding domain-containing protein n=1 Tax=Sanguibacter suaedae TaxID=2795737 RepID=A0A934I9C7_9MICO|nr:LysM peptidoglycan-binding domain-containing protein [Sanguibacter suaedae]MBI9115487.1 LysM peptidoglycan-binding domain-containing protein [Sanguibacter suaedae]
MAVVIEGPWVAGGPTRTRSTSRTVAGRAVSPQVGAVQDEGRLSDLRLTRRGRVVLWLAAVVVLGAVLLAGGRAVAGAPVAGTEVVPHTVAAGETLWALARDVAEPGEDVRDVVVMITSLNGRSSADLRVGEQILLPVR